MFPQAPQKVKHTHKSPRSAGLSDRQIGIIRMLYDEKSCEDIAKILFLSRRTIEWHKQQIFEKTGTTSLVGLVKYAIFNDLIE